MKARCLGVIACCLLTVSTSFTAVGCTQQQKINVAQEIVNWTPTIVSTAATVGATVSALDPASALIVSAAVAGFDAAAAEVKSAAQAYLANPNTTTLAYLQTLVTTFQQSVNSALLDAVKIVNPTTQKTVTAAIDALATGVNAVLALIQTVSTKAELKEMRSHVTVTLAEVRPYMDDQAMRAASATIGKDLGVQSVSVDSFYAHEAAIGF